MAYFFYSTLEILTKYMYVVINIKRSFTRGINQCIILYKVDQHSRTRVIGQVFANTVINESFITVSSWPCVVVFTYILTTSLFDVYTHWDTVPIAGLTFTRTETLFPSLVSISKNYTFLSSVICDLCPCYVRQYLFHSYVTKSVICHGIKRKRKTESSMECTQLMLC